MVRLRVAIAAPVPSGLTELITSREPSLELLYDPDLLPPMRHPADFNGNHSFLRTSEQQRAYEALVDAADALYGIPDVDADGLRRTVRANPGLRWVHTMAAGGGATVKAARLSGDELGRVVFTSSAGVHRDPLAEFAIFGVLAGAKQLPRLAAQQQARDWSDRWLMGQLREQTVLVVGLGGIGSRVVEILAAFGATIIGVSRRHLAVPRVEVIHSDELG